MRTDITKKTYYIKKSTVANLEELADSLNDGIVTKVVNECLEFGVFCLNLMIQKELKLEDIENIENIFEEGLDVYIKNRRDNS